MKRSLAYFCLLVILLLAACSKMQKEPVAQLHSDPPEMKAVNDSVEAYASAAGHDVSFDEYRNIYEHFLEKYPNSTELHRDFQSIFEGFDKPDEAAEYYKKLYDKNSSSAIYSYLYGRTLKGNEAEQLFRRAAELDPNYYWGNFGLAARLLVSTPPDTESAIEHFSKCLEIDNSYPSAYEQLSNVFFKRKNFDRALKYAQQYAVTSPDLVRPFNMQADILVAKGDLGQAESVWKNFADGHPKDVSSRRNLAKFYRDHQRYADALNYQRQLIKLSSSPGDAVFEVAKLFLMNGQTDSAMTFLTQATTMGFSDHRRITKNPLFDPIRSLPNYTELLNSIQQAADQKREMRLASIKENTDAQKEQALANQLNSPAPPFTFVNLEGKTVSLADLKGKVVVLDFWATWCGPCRMTMPLLQEYVDRKPSDVEFYSINVWENDTNLVRPFVADFGYSFNVLFGDRQITDNYKVNGIPTLFVIDKDGIIRYQHIGYDPHADQLLTWQTEALLAKPTASL